MKASLEAGELIVTKVDESILQNFDKEVEMKAYLAGLKHWEQKLHAQAEENYNEFSIAIRQRFSSVYGNLHSICDLGLRHRLEAEPEHQEMWKTKRYCAMR